MGLCLTPYILFESSSGANNPNLNRHLILEKCSDTEGQVCMDGGHSKIACQPIRQVLHISSNDYHITYDRILNSL